MIFELRDYSSGDTCGLVKVTTTQKEVDPTDEVRESWDEFNKLEEHELDSYSVEDFVGWHNECRVTQIERVFIDEVIQPC